MSYISNNLSRVSRRFLFEQSGAAASEYVLILGLVVVVVITAVAALGLHVSDTTSAVYSGLSGSTDANSGSFGPGSARSHTTAAFP